MTDRSLQDRARGALMGAFIGEALGVGPHWYYDLEELHREFGPWIDDYTTPGTDRYHAGLKAGQLSQPGFILKLTLRSLVECGGYNESDFCRAMDEDFFPLLDGTPVSGPGLYTSQSIREAWRRRVVHQQSWGRTGGPADTTEAIERTLAIAVRYARDPAQLARHVTANTLLTQTDGIVVAKTVAFAAVLGQLVQGERLDSQLSAKLMELVRAGALPFHTVTPPNKSTVAPGASEPPREGLFASPDALLTPSNIARAAFDPKIRIEPAWRVSIVYGMPCAIYHILPAAYYLAARFHDDFESAVLHAINGGGQNQARAMLTGALTGAQCGYSGIPQRFISGLEEHIDLEQLTTALAAAV